MKRIFLSIIIMALAASLQAGENDKVPEAADSATREKKESAAEKPDRGKKNFSDAGTLEIQGGISSSVSTLKYDRSSFGIHPAFQYYPLDKFHVGLDLLMQYTRYYRTVRYVFQNMPVMLVLRESRSGVDFGFAPMLGYTFKLSEKLYLDISPELAVLYGTSGSGGHSSFSPDVSTSLKYALNGALINFTLYHNFLTLEDNRPADVHYSLYAAAGFSIFF
ncbi:MAG: hypothetical protein MUD12_12975 [Spirochaetes bacterium]|jgi:hypothetical protein|nr:hypothetical protein [Spirochaetota bacterium]